MKKNNKSVENTEIETIIGKSLEIEGKIKSDGNIRIDGKVVGEIECLTKVIVSQNSEVKANITANEIIISGLVDGEVKANERLIITSTGKLIGKTATKSFTIDEGGTFLGNSNMKNN